MSEAVWDDARTDLLRALWADVTLSTSKIGERLGTTKNAIIGRARRLQLPPRKPCITRRAASGTGASSRSPRLPKAELPRDALPHPAPPPPRAYSPPTRLGPVRDCAWPTGTPGEPDFRLCGDKTEPGRSYCACHAQLAYVRPRTRAA